MNPSLQFDALSSNLDRLSERMPEVPCSGVMLSRLLLHLGRGIASMLENEIRPFGLSEAEFRVLTTLFCQRDGTAHPTELCANTSQSPANMSRISDALLNRGLLTRVSSIRDRRKLVLQITPSGEALVRELLPRLNGPLREMFEDFSDADQAHLIGRLKHLILKLDQAMGHRGAERAG
jgi:MarR family transcriptional repressor of emrRAB